MIDGMLMIVGHLTLSCSLAWMMIKGPRHCLKTVRNLLKD